MGFLPPTKMMGLTHAVMSVVVAIPFLYLYPQLALPIAVIAYLGGSFPDFDLFFGVHRKTLHYPVYFTVSAIATTVGFAVTTSTVLMFVSVFLCGAAIHSLMDIVGAGVEEKPWNQTNPHAVYVHPQNRWATARYWIPYDGSPHDLVVLAMLSVIVVYVYSEPVVTIGILVTLVISTVYTLVRKDLPAVKTYIESTLGFYPRIFP